MLKVLSRLRYMLLTNMYVLPGGGLGYTKAAANYAASLYAAEEAKKKAILRCFGWMHAATVM